MSTCGWIISRVAEEDEPETHRRIEIVEAEQRRAAVWIGHARLHAHAVAGLERRDRRSRFNHDAGRFMSEHHRCAHNERTDRAVFVIVDVAPAYADGVDADTHVVWTQRLVDLDLAEIERSDLFENDGLHGGWILQSGGVDARGLSRTVENHGKWFPQVRHRH
jgi:hypothetical protein